MSSDHGITYFELTDSESRLIRAQLDPQPGQTNSEQHQQAALAAYNRGIIRGTERLAREFAERQRAKKK